MLSANLASSTSATINVGSTQNLAAELFHITASADACGRALSTARRLPAQIDAAVEILGPIMARSISKALVARPGHHE